MSCSLWLNNQRVFDKATNDLYIYTCSAENICCLLMATHFSLVWKLVDQFKLMLATDLVKCLFTCVQNKVNPWS